MWMLFPSPCGELVMKLNPDNLAMDLDGSKAGFRPLAGN